VREVAKEYGVSYTLMSQIISCESQGDPTIQSHHRYTASNVPKGYKVGDREESYGLVQIHVPVHPVTKEQAKDPRFAVDFLAKNIAAGRASMWSCYSKGMIAMR